MLLILGVSGLIFPLTVQRKTIKYEVPFSLLAALVLYLIVNDEILWNSAENILSRWDAAILLFFFLLFMAYILGTMKNVSDYEETPIKIYGAPVSTAMIILGLAMLVGGGTLVVDNAVTIAEYYGFLKGLSALPSSPPARPFLNWLLASSLLTEKIPILVLGNVLGSNLFNILFILGVTGTISPIKYNTGMNFDIEVLGASTILLLIFMFTINQRKLDRWEAFILLGGYIAYTTLLIAKDNG